MLSGPESYISVLRGLRETSVVRSHAITLEFVNDTSNTTALGAALDKADAAIACGWSFSSEERDAPSLALQVGEKDLISTLNVAEPRQVPVVMLIGGRGPVLTPWRDRLSAMASMVYGGQEAGHGWAAVLTGATNPSGKLIFTWPRVDNQGPTLCDTSPVKLIPCDYQAKLADFDTYQQKAEPYEKFGFGLSFTTFEYSGLSCEAAREHDCTGECPWRASLTVRNTGQLHGSEVVQLYLHHPGALLTRTLAAFTKIRLAPGEARELTLDAHPLAVNGLLGRNGTHEPLLRDAELRVGQMRCALG